MLIKSRLQSLLLRSDKCREILEEIKGFLSKMEDDKQRLKYRLKLLLRATAINMKYLKLNECEKAWNEALKIAEELRESKYLARVWLVRHSIHAVLNEHDEDKAACERALRYKKEYLVEHHPEIAKIYFKLLQSQVWDRGNLDRMRSSILYNEKAMELLREQFGIKEGVELDEIYHCKYRLAKYHLKKFYILARSLKREEALQQCDKYLGLVKNCFKDNKYNSL